MTYDAVDALWHPTNPPAPGMRERFGRRPTDVELTIYSVMWGGHLFLQVVQRVLGQSADSVEDPSGAVDPLERVVPAGPAGRPQRRWPPTQPRLHQIPAEPATVVVRSAQRGPVTEQNVRNWTRGDATNTRRQATG